MANEWILGQPVATQTVYEWILGTSHIAIVTTGEVKELTGTITSQSVVTGIVKVTQEIIGATTCESTLTGVIEISKKVSGTVTGQLVTTGVLDVSKKINSSTSGQSVVSGSLKVTKELVGTTIIGQTVVSGTIDIGQKITGSIASQTIVSGDLETARNLTSSVNAQSTTSGTIEISKKVSGTVISESTVSGLLSGTWLFTGTVTAQSIVSGNLVLLAGGFSNSTENKILELITGKTSYSKPTVCIGFCTADPGEDATGANCNEVPDTNGYGRIATTTDDWNSAAAGAINNVNAFTSPCASGSWGEITHYVLLDSGTYGEGNVLVYDKLDTPKGIAEGDTIEFAAGELSLVLD